MLVEEWRRPHYAAEARRALAYAFDRHLNWPAKTLAGAAVVRTLDALPAAMAARTAAYGRACYRWSHKRGTLAVNPFKLLPSAPAGARDRVLTDSELAAVWRAADAAPAPFGPLVMLIGQRREEVGGMPWSELSADLATWAIPGRRTKNGEPHIVPLAEPVRAILQSMARHAATVFANTGGRAFNSWSKAKRRLDEAAGLDPWRVHDLRRTLASGLQRLGVRLEVTEAALNHKSGTRSGIVGVHQRHDWESEKLTALDAWAAHVLAVVEGREAHGRMVELRRAT